VNDAATTIESKLKLSPPRIPISFQSLRSHGLDSLGTILPHHLLNNSLNQLRSPVLGAAKLGFEFADAP
jgi:hypothetical protein